MFVSVERYFVSFVSHFFIHTHCNIASLLLLNIVLCLCFDAQLKLVHVWSQRSAALVHFLAPCCSNGAPLSPLGFLGCGSLALGGLVGDSHSLQVNSCFSSCFVCRRWFG